MLMAGNTAGVAYRVHLCNVFACSGRVVKTRRVLHRAVEACVNQFASRLPENVKAAKRSIDEALLTGISLDYEDIQHLFTFYLKTPVVCSPCLLAGCIMVIIPLPE